MYERLSNPKYITWLLEKEAGACNPVGIRKLADRFSTLFKRLQLLDEK